jgi:hypothetical protein
VQHLHKEGAIFAYTIRVLCSSDYKAVVRGGSQVVTEEKALKKLYQTLNE